MKYFPLFLDIREKQVLVVGGGRIAARRIAGLKDFGCHITVISPVVGETIRRMCTEDGIIWLERAYEEGDCAGYDLVLAATDSAEVNQTVARESGRAGALVNVCDDKSSCDFFFPGLVTRGDNVVIGITASGADHRLAARLRKIIEESVDREL